ncbi:unnamed protein product [Callosobruchus maculatus]|uniref:Uncharacterized protein n=1 Tax=Callosobruchus maculatus TaxID=64391 RepID=A0A653D8G8_CALMS|nr:unnamed protein product [Callosobruchus maculatus]
MCLTILQVESRVRDASSSKADKKIKELPRDRPFRITSAEVISGLFGESIVLHLEDGQAVYLPNRVTEVYKKNLGFFSSKKYAVIYEGVDCGYTEPLQSFKVRVLGIGVGNGMAPRLELLASGAYASRFTPLIGYYFIIIEISRGL